jgi:hypothetical protein
MRTVPNRSSLHQTTSNTLLSGVLLFAPVTLLACSGSSDVELPLDDGGPTSEGGNPDQDGGPRTDASGTWDGSTINCDPGACGLSAPQGFRLVTFASDRNTACPSGWTTSDVVASPIAGSGACSCACSVDVQPTCNDVTITRSYDADFTPSCNVAATTLTNASTTCQLIGGIGGLIVNKAHYEADRPKPVGGSCTTSSSKDASQVSATEARICAPSPSCTGDVCRSAGRVCLAADGDILCPSNYSSKTVVGTGTDLACSACGPTCHVTGGECGGSFTFFADFLCMAGGVAFPVDGACNPPPRDAVNKTYNSFNYDGQLTTPASCSALSQSLPTVTLSNKTTICCQ